jgi:hypothetical protein
MSESREAFQSYQLEMNQGSSLCRQKTNPDIFCLESCEEGINACSTSSEGDETMMSVSGRSHALQIRDVIGTGNEGNSHCRPSTSKPHNQLRVERRLFQTHMVESVNDPQDSAEFKRP